MKMLRYAHFHLAWVNDCFAVVDTHAYMDEMNTEVEALRL